MLKPPRLACLTAIACLFLSSNLTGQDSSSFANKVLSFPDRVFGSLSRKAEKTEARLTKSTSKYLRKLSRSESKLYHQLSRRDTAAAKDIFGNVEEKYNALSQLNTYDSTKGAGEYFGHLDSLKTSLKFFGQEKLLAQSPQLKSQLEATLKNYRGVQERMAAAGTIQKTLVERQRYLQEALQKYGMGQSLGKYKKEIYYYRAQVQEYKEMFKNPSRAEKKILSVANKIPAFKKFFNKFSDLASLFRMPSDEPLDLSSLQGLQTRTQLTQQLQQRFGTGPNVRQYLGGSMVDAQAGLNTLKDKFNQLGSSGADLDMPNFRPNEQKTKPFWNRLELGTSLQTQSNRNYFPITSDIGLSLGYKLNKKSVAGIGMSYKMGWGKDIKHIRITHQGIGLRSFADYQLKKSFYLTGGYEMNYLEAFHDVTELRDRSAWQQSGLVGITKKISLASKVLKKSQVQLLWDFLSYRQVPQTQPFVFRMGYSFK